MNSVDFKLQVVREEGRGMLPKTVGNLFVGQNKEITGAFAQMKVNKELKEFNGKIIECKWSDNQWVFMRERTDKAFPNGYNTAMGVIESIRNPVTEEMLLSLIEHQRWRKPVSEDLRQQEHQMMGPPPKRPRP
jgi:mRNA-capping enzyme